MELAVRLPERAVAADGVGAAEGAAELGVGDLLALASAAGRRRTTGWNSKAASAVATDWMADQVVGRAYVVDLPDRRHGHGQGQRHGVQVVEPAHGQGAGCV